MQEQTNIVAHKPSSRKATYALVDENLQFLTNNNILCDWLSLKHDTLPGRAVTAVFPELCKMEQTLKGLFGQRNTAVTLSTLFRAMFDGQSRYFDIQVEQALHLERTLTLHVIDVTPYTELRQYLGSENGNGLMAHNKEDAFNTLERFNRDLLLLNEAGRALTASLSMQDVLARLLDVATHLIGASDSSVWLWEVGGQEGATVPQHDTPTHEHKTTGQHPSSIREWLVCYAASDKTHRPPLEGQRLRRGQGIIGWVAENEQSTVVTDTGQDRRYYPNIDAQSGFTTNSMLAVPLQIHSETIGVLVIVNKREGVFNTHDTAIAETLAASASVAIYNARLVGRLQAQTQDLQARNEELDAFAHTVAHDLKNPLTILMGFATLLQRNDMEMTVDERKRILQSFSDNVYKINTIIQELLLLSSVRKQDVQLKPLSMHQIVGSALARLSHLIDEAEATFILPDKWPTALGYAPWIEEVWENYLSNALKYGGKPPLIEVGGTHLADGRVQFWVRDNGRGLSDEDQTRLFTPFTNLSQVYMKGHGLGLSIVQRIVTKLGGSVAVESEIGKGSEFSFTLSSG